MGKNVFMLLSWATAFLAMLSFCFFSFIFFNGFYIYIYIYI